MYEVLLKCFYMRKYMIFFICGSEGYIEMGEFSMINPGTPEKDLKLSYT